MTDTADIREYAEVAGNGLPRFVVGYEYEIGGQRLRVVKVLSSTTNPLRVKVEVEALR